MPKIYLYAIGIWFILLVSMVINGEIRNSIYQPIVGELLAHQISTVIAIIILLIITYLFLKSLKITYSSKNLILIGVIWAGITIVFEFLFGYYVAGHSWNKLLTDYNIFAGRLWSLFLLAIVSAPFLIGKLIKK